MPVLAQKGWLVALGVAVLLGVGQADQSKKPPTAPFATPQDAVKAWLAAQQQPKASGVMTIFLTAK
jgi:hypothetical protein